MTNTLNAETLQHAIDLIRHQKSLPTFILFCKECGQGSELYIKRKTMYFLTKTLKEIGLKQLDCKCWPTPNIGNVKFKIIKKLPL